MDDEPRWLTPEELDHWVHVTAMVATLPVVVAEQLKRDAGLGFFEYHVLARLSAAPGRALQMAVLADITQGSQSRLSHAVTRLERAGWVDRRSGPSTTRAVEAVLTPAGLEKLEQSAPGHVAQVRRSLVDVLTAEEFAQLGALSRKVLAATAPEVLDSIDALERDEAPPPAA
jgi:DNA-binding MarR family transcriptional regulator